MRYAFLIALREFVENAKTKGFWIGIFTFPVLFGISIAVSVLLASSNPTRHFFIVDQSGQLAASIEHAVERAHQGAVLGALNRYAQENVRSEMRTRPDLSAIPNDLAEQAGNPAGDPQAIDRFLAAGGAAAFLERLRPSLDPNAPEFVEPPPEHVRLDLPAGIDANANIATIAQQLRPYLNGALTLRSGGKDVKPFAAILIAPDALAEVARPDGSPANVGRSPAGVGGLAPGHSPARASRVQYWSSNLTDRRLPELVGRALNDEVRSREYVDRGVSRAVVRQVQGTSIRLSSFDPGKEEGKETVSLGDRIVRSAPVAFVYLLWISIFVVMQMLLNNTIEEKSNRIIEVLLSSVTPSELMMGKLIGIAGIGFTMVGTWLATAFIGMQLYQGPGTEVIGQALDVLSGSGLVPTFFVYFLLGYLLYAGIFLSAGSLCNSLKEAQSLQGPMMMIMIVPLMTMVFINMDPHGTLARIMTWIPIYTPFVMMNRAAADPPLFDLVGSALLVIATTAVVLWLSGRIFRIGILRTGQRPKLVEVLRWMRGVAEP